MEKFTQMIVDLSKKIPDFNSRAVLFALIAGWITGVVWYMIVGRVWKSVANQGEGGAMTPRAQILSAIAQVIMTIMLAIAMQRLGENTVRGGLQTAFGTWFGFIATSMVVSYSNLRARFRLTFIDCLHWLWVMLVMGAIIGALSDAPTPPKP